MLRFFLVVGLLVVGACDGDDSDDDAPVNAGEPVVEKSVGVGGDGGDVASTTGDSAGAAVLVPPGALVDEVDVEIGTVDDPPALDAGQSAAGPEIYFGPEGQTFNEAVVITIPFDSAGAEADKLRLFTRDLDDDTRTEVPILTVDMDAGEVTAAVMHFSTFVVTSSATVVHRYVGYGTDHAGEFYAGPDDDPDADPPPPAWEIRYLAPGPLSMSVADGATSATGSAGGSSFSATVSASAFSVGGITLHRSLDGLAAAGAQVGTPDPGDHGVFVMLDGGDSQPAVGGTYSGYLEDWSHATQGWVTSLGEGNGVVPASDDGTLIKLGPVSVSLDAGAISGDFAGSYSVGAGSLQFNIGGTAFAVGVSADGDVITGYYYLPKTNDDGTPGFDHGTVALVRTPAATPDLAGTWKGFGAETNLIPLGEPMNYVDGEAIIAAVGELSGTLAQSGDAVTGSIGDAEGSASFDDSVADGALSSGSITLYPSASGNVMVGYNADENDKAAYFLVKTN